MRGTRSSDVITAKEACSMTVISRSRRAVYPSCHARLTFIGQGEHPPSVYLFFFYLCVIRVYNIVRPVMRGVRILYRQIYLSSIYITTSRTHFRPTATYYRGRHRRTMILLFSYALLNWCAYIYSKCPGPWNISLHGRRHELPFAFIPRVRLSVQIDIIRIIDRDVVFCIIFIKALLNFLLFW